MDRVLFTASTDFTPETYKEIYKTYYKEKFRVFNIISDIIAVLCAAAAVYMYLRSAEWYFYTIAAWVAVFLFIYPRVSYRKSYKRARTAKQLAQLEFFESYMTEKTSKDSGKFFYRDLGKLIETKKYFFIFHDDDNMSAIDKSSVQDVKALSDFLHSKLSA